MFRLARYLRGYRRECVLAPLFKLLEAAFQLLVPLVMAQVIDVGIATGDRPYILGRGVALVAMGLVGLASSITAQYFCARLGAGFGTGLRDDLFRHAMGLSRGDVDGLGRATLVTRITNDSQQVQDGVNLFFRLVLRSPFVVLGAVGLSWAVDGAEGLAFTVTVAVLLVTVLVVMGRASRRYREAQRRLDGIVLGASEALEGVRVVRAFCREGDEAAAFDDATDGLSAAQVKAGDVSALVNPLTYAAANLGLVAVLYAGGVGVDAGAMTQGQLVALVNYSAQVLVELIQLANLVVLLARATACASRVNEVLAVSGTMPDGLVDAADAVPSVEFRDVTFSYPGGSSPALSHVSFSVAPGETVGIIGGTGSGKSTLANLVARFYDVASGEVLVGGRDVRDYRVASLRKFVGVVEQEVRLFSGTIASNLRWGDPAASDSQLERAVAVAQATDVVATREEGLGSAVEQLGRNLSGGQRQRLAIARTLVRRPRVLVLDDSSSALDFATDAALRRSLGAMGEGTTTIAISQRVTSIRHADRILVLDRGRLVGSGTHGELLEACEVYREICDSQLSGKEVPA